MAQFDTKPSSPTSCAWPATSQSYEMHCMEVWGGNGAIDTGLKFHGLNGWLASSPYQGDASGGDVHYVSLCGRGRVARFMLADVAGHGNASHELATQLKGVMRRHIGTPDQRRLARSVNRAFSKLSDEGVFATAAMLTYFAPTRHLISCLAGHMRPLWYRAATGQWLLLSHELPQSVTGPAGLPFGIVHPTEYYQFSIQLEPGDMIAVYTDAMIETGGPTSAAIGEEGLLDLARDIGPLEPEAFGRELIDRAEKALGVGPQERTDDLSLLVLRCTGEQPPSPSLAQYVKLMASMLGVPVNPGPLRSS